MKVRAKLYNSILEHADTMWLSSKEENIGENFFSMYDSRDFEGFCANQHLDPGGSKPALRYLY